MGKETKRGLIRIGSNYGRLMASLVLSIAFVPMLLVTVESAGLGVILLFGSTVGIAAMFQEMTHRSMVRELGAAYHRGSDAAFLRTYHSAMTVAVFMALITAAVFAALWFLVPYFNLEGVAEERPVVGLEDAARGMIVARGIASVIKIVLSPPFNMLLITERMVSYNFWQLIVQRAHGFLAAGALLLIRPESIAEGVILFAWISSAISIAAVVIASAIEMFRNRRLLPSFRFTNRADVKDIVHTTGWNSAVIFAMNLYMRADAIIMNLVFGLLGNVTFGLAILLTGYARRITVGMTDGLDAVSARVQSEDRLGALQALIRRSTKLHAVVAFPAAFFIAILADPLMRLWIGRRIDDPNTIPLTAMMIQILMCGIAARGVSDGWARILYGIGKVRDYAPHMVMGAVTSPLLGVSLIWILPRGSTLEFMALCIATSLVMIVNHVILLPMNTAKAAQMTFFDVMHPMTRPFVLAAAVSLLPLAAILWIDQWSIIQLMVVSAIFGAAYLVGTIVFVMDSQDRKVARKIVERLRMRAGGRPRRVAGEES